MASNGINPRFPTFSPSPETRPENVGIRKYSSIALSSHYIFRARQIYKRKKAD